MTRNSILCQSLIADARGAADDALELLQEVFTLAQRRGRQWISGHAYHAWVLCNLEQFDASFHALATYHQLSERANYVPRADRLLFATTVAARLLAHRGEFSRAVELLGLTFTHPNGPRGYLQEHEGINQLCRDLEAELGPEAYHAAWERGAALDPNRVLADLQAKYTP